VNPLQTLIDIEVLALEIREINGVLHADQRN
jgi:hypothetical protein